MSGEEVAVTLSLLSLLFPSPSLCSGCYLPPFFLSSSCVFLEPWVWTLLTGPWSGLSWEI